MIKETKKLIFQKINKMDKLSRINKKKGQKHNSVLWEIKRLTTTGTQKNITPINTKSDKLGNPPEIYNLPILTQEEIENLRDYNQ